MGFRHCPLSPTVALYVLLNSSVEAMLMCLDLLTLSSCARTPLVETTNAYTYVDSLSIRAHIFHIMYCKPLKLGVEFFLRVSPEEHVVVRGGYAIVFYIYSLVSRGT
ncbi:hypothetical protein M9H77_12959 [Catharanthus roseus]|uniref:Uncharacterized protein n=1 Tax=Catharanthus roseus TaxID=4058 RepID=A0ACC0BIY1_CATRO|nr:hypothetical protein M9H77_12959 [Catharanthus roseus]